MRCKACNVRLTDYEATRKSATTGKYEDLCNHCFGTIEDVVPVIDRKDLLVIEAEADDENCDRTSL